jgi:hypothetical protein
MKGSGDEGMKAYIKRFAQHDYNSLLTKKESRTCASLHPFTLSSLHPFIFKVGD